MFYLIYIQYLYYNEKWMNHYIIYLASIIAYSLYKEYVLYNHKTIYNTCSLMLPATL